MPETINYDAEESLYLAEALQKKEEQSAQNRGLSYQDAKKQGIKKYNEVRRRHAIDFLAKIETRLEQLNNQAIANLLKTLISLGLSIEDEEELEYWINLLTKEVLRRFNEYFQDRSPISLWQQITSGNNTKKINLANYSENDISAFIDIVASLRQINASKHKAKSPHQRIEKFLDKLSKTLQNDLKQKRTEKGNQNKKERPQQREEPLEILKNKMSAEGIESDGRYWNQVISDFDAALDKESFARKWVVDTNSKNESDIQRINELRGIENEKTKQNEQMTTQEQQKSKDQQIKQDKEQKEFIKNTNDTKIKEAFQNPKNQKAAQKYAEKKEQKTGKPLNDKDIQMLKLKAIGNKGR